MKKESNLVQQKREYRLVTGGEDGMIIWWNFKASFDESLFMNPDSKQSSAVGGDASSYEVVPDPAKLTDLKPAHHIQLSVSAQIYALILGPR